MKKKGLSNIEFILSFILFAVFVMAALYLINPVKSTRLLESSKNFVVGQVTGNASVEVYSYSVKMETSGSCSGDIIAVSAPATGSGKNARVEDYYGAALLSKKSGGNVVFERGSNNFAVVKFSEDFDAGNLTKEITVTGTNCYTIASSYSSKALSEKKILEMNRSYYADYNALKKKLNIPENINFGFTLKFDNNKMIVAEREAPLRVDVFSETSRTEIIKKDGSSEFGQFVIRTW